MAESPEPGAPIPKDAIDPELVKLRGPRPKIGLLTAAGMVFLCAFFIWKLNADRTFGGEGDNPHLVQVADVAGGKVDAESFVEIPAEPMMSHAIRATKTKGDPGLRVTPVRGSSERVWLVLDGVGWDPPTTTGRYAGRLRVLADLPFAEAVREHAAKAPRPVFATAANVRAAFANGQLKTVDGDTLAIRDTDRAAFEVVDPNVATIVATFAAGTPEHAPLLDAGAWQRELEKLGIPAKPLATDEKDTALGQARFQASMPVADITSKLEKASLWAARVEPVTRHHQLTWAELKASPIAFDLVGVYVTRPIPDDAYALLVGEVPQDYWYILPITIIVAVIGLLFLWALIRTVRRDLLPARA